MLCNKCCQQIENERLTVIPHTTHCGTCAKMFNPEKKRKGYMSYGHKTAAEICILEADVFKEQKKYIIPNGARSCVKNFSKSTCS